MPTRAPIVRLLKDPAVVPLFIARLISSAGVGFGQLALAWGVMSLGYGPGALSFVIACKALPALLLLAGGIVGDRFRRHQVLAGAEILASVTWVALGACFITGKAPFVLLCGLAALSGVATAMFLPALRGIVADLLRSENRQVGNALISQTDSIGLLIGLASAGLVVTAVGPGWAAAARGVLCGVSALLLTRLRTSRWRRTRTHPLIDLRVGWREFIAYRWVWVMTLQFTAVIIAVASFSEVIGPLYMSQGHGGAGAWGIVVACEAGGALAGGLIGAVWRPVRPVLVATILPVSAALPMLLLGNGAPWFVLAIAMLLPGICQAVYYVLWTTELQQAFHPEVLARVNSWGIVGSYFLAPIALVLVGPLVQVIGAQRAAVGAGLLVMFATALAALLLRAGRGTQEESAVVGKEARAFS